jgi:hypothetical protein
MCKTLRDNSLSLVMFALFVLFLVGHSLKPRHNIIYLRGE